MRDHHDAILATGATLAVIGSGNPAQAAAFQKERALPFPLYCDTKLRAYAAAGLRRSVGSTFSPRAVLNGLRAFSAGHGQGKVEGDPWQQGGAVVITPAGEVALHQISRSAGDHVDPAKVLAVLKRLSTAAQEPQAG